MLVLLIMFIITLPLMTHSVKIDLPGRPDDIQRDPEVHRLALDSASRLSLGRGARSPRPSSPPASPPSAPRSRDDVLHFRAEAANAL